MIFRHIAKFVIVFTFAIVSAAHAQTLNWGTTIASTPVGFYSSGSPSRAPLTWTIGYFKNSFVPTSENSSEWISNYVEVDRTNEVFDTEESIYGVSGYKLNVGSASGKDIWVFAYSNLEYIGTPAGEALLFKHNGFLFPSVIDVLTVGVNDDPNTSADDAMTVVWGQVDRRRLASGGSITGGGIFSNQLADTSNSTWITQTATWPATGNEPPLLLTLAKVNDPSFRGKNDDPDKDGKSNIIEHLIGTNPNTSDSQFTSVNSVNSTAATFTLPATRPNDVRYTIYHSHDLTPESWVELARAEGNSAWSMNTPISTTNISDSLQIVEFASPVTPVSDKRFFRVLYELISPP